MQNFRIKKESWLATVMCCTAVLILAMTFLAPSCLFAAQAKQKTFASADEAVKALIEAAKTDDMKKLTAIFGPAGKEVLFSGDPVRDRAGRQEFLNAFEEKHFLIKEGDNKAILQIGNEEWPFPIPVVQKNGKWSFDTKAGKEEIINRRIGKNELDTIQVCLAYVDAQREYAQTNSDKVGLHEYAQKIVSDKGTRNGLYWESKEGEMESPMGDFAARATREGYKKTGAKPIPYHGYYFKILKAQGKDAPGGAVNYVVNGKMIGGFALVAWPAQYGSSGIMTFIVNYDGVVYQKNLGKNTARIAEAMTVYNPDATWKKAEDVKTGTK
ncbi:MAG: hypothetical protein H6Q52_1050 [Deltaproteobacteria bacterium]|nr:hypothetical protein [Deltaproteobacteria bacterium]